MRNLPGYVSYPARRAPLKIRAIKTMTENKEEIQIIAYDDVFKSDFRRINLEWLDKYNLTESHDLMVLDDPRGTILNRGGFIWLANSNEGIIGSAALMKEHDDVYELAKMAVTDGYRGRGIGKKLIQTCLAKAREIHAKKLTLFSNHQLQAALKMYEQHGFRHVEVKDSPFATADIKMELVF
jgi:GNAT superfamily N-acetyltransferase